MPGWLSIELLRRRFKKVLALVFKGGKGLMMMILIMMMMMLIMMMTKIAISVSEVQIA